MEPVADTSEAPKIRALQIDPLLSFGAAQLAQLELGRRARLVAAEVARDLVLDRHPVTVPSGDERRAKSQHRARPHDEVLQNFVERSPEMHAAVGIRRAVVQHPGLRVFARLHQARVEVEFVPMLEHLRLPLGQIRLHRKVGLGKFQGRFVIGLSHSFFQVLDASDQINARGVASRASSLNSLSLPPGSREDLLEPLDRVDAFEQCLLFRNFDLHMVCNQVRKDRGSSISRTSPGFLFSRV